MKYNCIVVLGPTASGKTKLACGLASLLNGEIISADSRQVYKYLNIGTGKDLQEYFFNDKPIAHHLIDIREPQQQFYLHEFIKECELAFVEILKKNKLPVICGGTGLYLDSLRKDYSFTTIPEDTLRRKELEALKKQDLINIIKEFPAEIVEHVDLHSKKRIIRGIEIAEYRKKFAGPVPKKLSYRPLYIGLEVPVEERKNKITKRLKERLNSGLIEEVQGLVNKGITHERLMMLGLEYKFISLYLQQKLSKEMMQSQLETAIFQYAKRQMTWFRKMEKEGVQIHWISPEKELLEIVQLIQIKLSET